MQSQAVSLTKNLLCVLFMYIYHLGSNETNRSMRSKSMHKSAVARTGVLEKKCIFCEKELKKHKGKKQALQLCMTKKLKKVSYVMRKL